MIKQAVTYAKQHTPDPLRVAVRRAMLEARNARLRATVPVVARCEFDNVYHCTVRKTASQWIKALLADPVIYRYSGLLLYDRRLYKRSFPRSVPTGRAVSSLFVSYQRFQAIPKPERHRAFFVIRDPRDIVVSSYFSNLRSHTPMGDVPEVRKALQDKPQKDGLIYVINHLAKKGQFRALRSWATAPSAETFRLFRYEDLTGEGQRAEVDRLLRHCGIALPDDELTGLLSRHSFSRMRSSQGTVGSVSHYRKGKPGDWRNHFDDDVQEAFVAANGDLVEVLGYPSTGADPA